MIVSAHAYGKVMRYKKEDYYKPETFIESDNRI